MQHKITLARNTCRITSGQGELGNIHRLFTNDLASRSTAYSTGAPSPGKGTAYAHGELRDIHCFLANYDQTVNGMQHKITLARNIITSGQGGLGNIQRLLANYDQAVNCMQHRITLAR
jgi:hypothetical protein